jgi:hypothetical protein
MFFRHIYYGKGRAKGLVLQGTINGRKIERVKMKIKRR